MAKRRTAALVIVCVTRSLFCQSGGFPMEEYERAVAARDFSTIAGIIKEHGTNTDYYEQSVLWRAIQSDDVELVRVMLEAGIPTELNSYTDAGVFSVYYPTIRDDRFEMVELLVEYYPISASDVDVAVSSGNIGVLDLFARKGVDLLGVHESGGYYSSSSFTYFNAAARSGRLELAERFLWDGHSVNTLDTYARLDYQSQSNQFPTAFPTIASALDYARASGDQELTDWHLRHGAQSGYRILHSMRIEEIEKRFEPRSQKARVVAAYALQTPGPYGPQPTTCASARNRR